ncbi:hypothetical protein NA57DRAFT_70868 [Rhizodiscina lignyota]|uniref:RGS domain-containing protein n=1 Tax=Rhizodiscina lignyota TaxID=1504668 RepID=A0A9P4IR99_9PEZI|nr:hypothetical protein NA57DRAFT_70868 [Rhizodiscina lignyota]
MAPTIILPGGLSKDGHDWGAPLLDALGITYIVIAIAYTLLVFFGLYRLWLHRNEVAVRLRGFWTIASAVILLLTYGAWVIIVYPLNGLFKCNTEFWVMSVFLPTSIGLFQASNIRLLSYYQAQQDLADDAKTLAEKKKWTILLNRGPVAFWKQLDTAQKTYFGIAVGIVIQLIVTLVLYFGSRLFNERGFFGTHVGPGECRRGWEWVPSAFWQFLWAWVFGPFVLIKIWNIKDVHYWARQTRIAILAGLAGTPLWLVFIHSNSPGVANVNKWWMPAGWFLPGIWAMQFVSIWYPLKDARESRKRRQGRCIDCILDANSHPISNRDDYYSMGNLEGQIDRRIEQLLKYAAEKTFTAENILFIREVRDFKRRWEVAMKRSPLSLDQLRERFEEAALIFFTLVNPATAKFNINLDYKTYLDLSLMFRGCDYQRDDDGSELSKLTAGTNDACPWETQPEDSLHSADTSSGVLDIELLCKGPGGKINGNVSAAKSNASSITVNAESELEFPHVPGEFSIKVFDKAYDIVKKDVYLNMWIRYEKEVGKPIPQRKAEAASSTTLSFICHPSASLSQLFGSTNRSNV